MAKTLACLFFFGLCAFALVWGGLLVSGDNPLDVFLPPVKSAPTVISRPSNSAVEAEVPSATPTSSITVTSSFTATVYAGGVLYDKKGDSMGTMVKEDIVVQILGYEYSTGWILVQKADKSTKWTRSWMCDLPDGSVASFKLPTPSASQ